MCVSWVSTGNNTNVFCLLYKSITILILYSVMLPCTSCDEKKLLSKKKMNEGLFYTTESACMVKHTNLTKTADKP